MCLLCAFTILTVLTVLTALTVLIVLTVRTVLTVLIVLTVTYCTYCTYCTHCIACINPLDRLQEEYTNVNRGVDHFSLTELKEAATAVRVVSDQELAELSCSRSSADSEATEQRLSTDGWQNLVASSHNRQSVRDALSSTIGSQHSALKIVHLVTRARRRAREAAVADSRGSARFRQVQGNMLRHPVKPGMGTLAANSKGRAAGDAAPPRKASLRSLVNMSKTHTALDADATRTAPSAAVDAAAADAAAAPKPPAVEPPPTAKLAGGAATPAGGWLPPPPPSVCTSGGDDTRPYLRPRAADKPCTSPVKGGGTPRAMFGTPRNGPVGLLGRGVAATPRGSSASQPAVPSAALGLGSAVLASSGGTYRARGDGCEGSATRPRARQQRRKQAAVGGDPPAPQTGGAAAYATDAPPAVAPPAVAPPACEYECVPREDVHCKLRDSKEAALLLNQAAIGDEAAAQEADALPLDVGPEARGEAGGGARRRQKRKPRRERGGAAAEGEAGDGGRMAADGSEGGCRPMLAAELLVQPRPTLGGFSPNTTDSPMTDTGGLGC